MEEDNDQEIPISKSQRKRDMHELQGLGRQLTELSARSLEEITLPAELRAALEEYRRLPNSHGARRRQLHFIGKLMRTADVEPIRNFLDRSSQKTALEKRKFNQLETLREQLIAGENNTLEQLIGAHPQLDIQHLRQLIRQSQKELKEKKPPSASRKLFRYLRDLQ